MPRRLLLAAEILLDVARTVNAADRPLLEDAAAELIARAAEFAAAEGVSLDRSSAMLAPQPPVHRPAACFEAVPDHARGMLVH